jgi:hypothetical protein
MNPRIKPSARVHKGHCQVTRCRKRGLVNTWGCVHRVADCQPTQLDAQKSSNKASKRIKKMLPWGGINASKTPFRAKEPKQGQQADKVDIAVGRNRRKQKAVRSKRAQTRPASG